MSTLKRCIPIIITHLAVLTSVSTLATAFSKGTFDKDLQVLVSKKRRRCAAKICQAYFNKEAK